MILAFSGADKSIIIGDSAKARDNEYLMNNPLYVALNKVGFREANYIIVGTVKLELT